jgi:hypothetical protein
MEKKLISVLFLLVALFFEPSVVLARGGSAGCGSNCGFGWLIFPVALVLYALFRKK